MENSGEFLQIMGFPAQAIQSYNKQLESKLDYNLLIQRAIAYQSLQNHVEARKDIAQALSIDSKRYEAHFRLGVSEFQECKLLKAKQDLEKAEQLCEGFAKDTIQIWLRKCEAEIALQKPQKDDSKRATYQWYQTDKQVKVQFLQSVNSKNDVQSDFKNKQVEFSFKSIDGNLNEFTFDLYDEIIPEECKIELNLQKIELQLAKKDQNKNWPKLNAINIYEENQQLPPSSAKVKSQNQVKRDWNKIDKDIEKDLAKEKEGDPMNDLFKQIYSNGDEATRRAMIKSFQTSGGTVLSTNWKEVEKKDYEDKDRPSAPEGQTWNKW